MSHQTEHEQARSQLLARINLALDDIIQTGDRLQKLAKQTPGLTALCDFNQPQRMRRLLTVPEKAWKGLDLTWCRQAVARIDELKRHKGDAATLALALLGVRREGLAEALEAAEAAAQETPADTAPEAAPDKSPKKRQANKKTSSLKPAPAPEEGDAEMGQADDELDPETREALEALQEELAELEKS